MVLNQKQTTIAYRCPVCGMGVMSMVGVFALSGDMLKLKCECGKSELRIVYTRDKKIRLTVPCLFCPKPHGFTISSSIFFGRDIFTLPCPLSGIDVCFIGKQDQVEKAMQDSEKELMSFLTEEGLDDFHSFDENEDDENTADDSLDAEVIGKANLNAIQKHNKGTELFSDPQILEIIMFVIKDLQEEGKISCKCGIGSGEYSVSVEDEYVIITCDKCGAKTKIPAGSTIAANAFLHTDFLELK